MLGTTVLLIDSLSCISAARVEMNPLDNSFDTLGRDLVPVRELRRSKMNIQARNSAHDCPCEPQPLSRLEVTISNMSLALP